MGKVRLLPRVYKKEEKHYLERIVDFVDEVLHPV